MCLESNIHPRHIFTTGRRTCFNLEPSEGFEPPSRSLQDCRSSRWNYKGTCRTRALPSKGLIQSSFKVGVAVPHITASHPTSICEPPTLVRDVGFEPTDQRSRGYSPLRLSNSADPPSRRPSRAPVQRPTELIKLGSWGATENRTRHLVTVVRMEGIEPSVPAPKAGGLPLTDIHLVERPNP